MKQQREREEQEILYSKEDDLRSMNMNSLGVKLCTCCGVGSNATSYFSSVRQADL